MSGVEPAALRVFADPRWGQPCLAYNVQIPVRGAAAQTFADVQTTLSRYLPGLRPIPNESLHISLYGVIPVGWQSAAKETHWDQVSDQVSDTLERSSDAARAFSLTFDRVRVDPFAVIALAAEWPPVVDQLRQGLGAAARAAGVPGPSYSIVHCTLARFAHAADLSPALVAEVETTLMHAVVRVERFRLVRERVYPSLVLDVLAEYPLCGPSRRD